MGTWLEVWWIVIRLVRACIWEVRERKVGVRGVNSLVPLQRERWAARRQSGGGCERIMGLHCCGERECVGNGGGQGEMM